MKLIRRKKIKIKLKVGDLVRVISGASKGKEARILKINYSNNRALVEGVNMVTKHKKPTARNVKGAVLEIPSYVDVSNLCFVDNNGRLTKLGKRIDPDSGKLCRYSKKSGEFIQ